MLISARVESDPGRHEVTVTTNGVSRPVDIPPRAAGRGSSVNGGELLCLALATCYCNDLFREARKRDVELGRVEVEVDAQFGDEGEPARRVSYRARATGNAPRDQLLALLRDTDRLAEVQNTVRRDMPVVLDAVEAEAVLDRPAAPREFRLPLPAGAVRPWRRSDAEALARHANDRRVWLGLRDAFPHPYGLDAAHAFLDRAAATSPVTSFAIEVDGEAAGGIGYVPGHDVERISAEIGYWLGAACWGRGIMTAALRAVTAHAFAVQPDLRRLFALPYAGNHASARVLEKAGYRFEGRLRQSAIKDGQITDQALYAILRDELAAR